MKQLNRIKLHKLSQAELAEKEEKQLVGGQCGCIGFCLCMYPETKKVLMIHSMEDHHRMIMTMRIQIKQLAVSPSNLLLKLV
mgnify:CR=1 FL=1